MSYTGESYVKSLISINKELKRINDDKKKLIAYRKKVENSLYDFMTRNGHTSFGGYTLKKLEKSLNKEPAIRKKKKEKERDAIQFFYEIGAPDPEGFYTKFIQTQKI